MIMQVAFSSVNCGLNSKPSAVKNFTERSRSLTGRLTNSWRGMGSPCGWGLEAGEERSRGSGVERLEAVHQPALAVLVLQRAETVRPERLGDRHLHGATFGQRGEH